MEKLSNEKWKQKGGRSGGVQIALLTVALGDGMGELKRILSHFLLNILNSTSVLGFLLVLTYNSIFLILSGWLQNKSWHRNRGNEAPPSSPAFFFHSQFTIVGENCEQKLGIFSRLSFNDTNTQQEIFTEWGYFFCSFWCFVSFHFSRSRMGRGGIEKFWRAGGEKVE